MQNVYMHKQKKILVELLHGLGDTVCAIPMLKVLREHYQEARIDVVCKFDVCAQILRCSDIHIDNYYVLDVFSNPVNIYKFMLLCKENSYDYGIASPHTPVIKAKFFMNFIIRPGRWFGLQKQGIFFDMLPDECHHVKAHFLALEGLIKGNFEHICPELYPEKHYTYLNSDFCNEINRMKCMKNVVGICIGNADFTYKYRLLRCGKVYAKGWGINNIRKLIEKLLVSDTSVILIGGKQEKDLVPALGNKILVSDNVINLVGKTTIIESMLVAKQCKCIVGVDTGMMHIAAAVGIYTVSIMGPTSPYKHGAYANNSSFIYHPELCEKVSCYGTRDYARCEDRKCLKNISVDEVYDIVYKLS